jgi:hypothetical protein
MKNFVNSSYCSPNSYKDILEVLEDNVLMTENEIYIEAFGYDRNNNNRDNKKYADMLRRTMSRGLIGRKKIDRSCMLNRELFGRAQYYYFLTA